MRKKVLLSTIGLLIMSQANAENNQALDKKDPFSFEASYIGDYVGNMSGGIKTGTAYLGMGNIKVGFDAESANMWKGGSFFINGASIHGESPTDKLVGDFQVISNIDGGEHTYMHELWYNQTFKNFEFTIGLQDLNATFASTENGAMYINSSFGIPPVISDNVPVPIFPLTGLGLSTKWNLTENLAWSGAIFDGCPSDFDKNKYNLEWNLNDEEGLLLITEIQLNKKNNKLSGSYKAGYYYHTGLSEKDEETGISSSLFNHNYGLYIIIYQTIMKKSNNKKIDFFSQIAISPSKVNNHNYYLSGGINYFGIFDKSGENALGMAFAYAGFHNRMHKHETTIEAYYKAQITENIFLQPDIQYVINPSGSDIKLENSFVGILRLGLNF